MRGSSENGKEFKPETYQVDGTADIYLYTDGAYEATLPDGPMMKIDDLVGHISENRNRDSKEIDTLYNYLVDLNSSSHLNDDFTMIR